MAAQPPREQALPLLAAANNHGDLAVKLSSLKQVKDILLSAEPSQAAQLFPFLVDLQSSPESLVRKTLIDLTMEAGLKSLEHLSILMPVLLTLLKDQNSLVAKQSSAAGTIVFCRVLEEIALQFYRHGIVEAWHEELWSWMVKFKDAVIGILFEAAPLGLKLLTIKFLETHVVLFTPDKDDSERALAEALSRNGQAFNISWLVGHPFLDPVSLSSDANGSLGVLLDLLQAAGDLPGLLTISVVNRGVNDNVLHPVMNLSVGTFKEAWKQAIVQVQPLLLLQQALRLLNAELMAICMALLNWLYRYRSKSF